jgi:hypothetical protein
MASIRSNQVAQSGGIITAALTGTGSAATLFSGIANQFIDLVFLCISGTASDSAVLSDGTNSYTIKIGASAPLVLHPMIPFKQAVASLGSGWTLNMASTSFAAAEAIVLSS